VLLQDAVDAHILFDLPSVSLTREHEAFYLLKRIRRRPVPSAPFCGREASAGQPDSALEPLTCPVST